MDEKESKEGTKEKGKKKIPHYILVSSFIIVFMLVLLLVIDQNSKWVAGALSEIGINNFFSGDTWFSIIGSFVIGIPGILCGILALIQTDRLNRFEQRYHRPNLGLRSASLKYKRWDTDFDCNAQQSHDERMRAIELKSQFEKICKTDQKLKGMQALLDLELEFELKNDIEVSNMVLVEIIWEFGKKRYHFSMQNKEIEQALKPRRKFRRETQDDHYMIRVREELFLCASSEGENDSFWDAVEYFANYNNHKRFDYKELTLELKIQEFYQYCPTEYDEISVKTEWDAGRGYEERPGAGITHHTNSGFVFYQM